MVFETPVENKDLAFESMLEHELVRAAVEGIAYTNLWHVIRAPPQRVLGLLAYSHYAVLANDPVERLKRVWAGEPLGPEALIATSLFTRVRRVYDNGLLVEVDGYVADPRARGEWAASVLPEIVRARPEKRQNIFWDRMEALVEHTHLEWKIGISYSGDRVSGERFLEGGMNAHVLYEWSGDKRLGWMVRQREGEQRLERAALWDSDIMDVALTEDGGLFHSYYWEGYNLIPNVLRLTQEGQVRGLRTVDAGVQLYIHRESGVDSFYMDPAVARAFNPRLGEIVGVVTVKHPRDGDGSEFFLEHPNEEDRLRGEFQVQRL